MRCDAYAADRDPSWLGLPTTPAVINVTCFALFLDAPHWEAFLFCVAYRRSISHAEEDAADSARKHDRGRVMQRLAVR